MFILKVSLRGRLVLVGYKKVIWRLVGRCIIDLVSVLDVFVVETLVEIERLTG
jgi:hypothetical protein